MPQLTRLMDSSNEKQISWFQEERSGFFLTWVTDLYPQTQVETGEPSSAFLLPLSLPGPSRGERGRPHGEEGKDSSVTTPSRGQPSLVLEKERGVFLRAAEAGPCGRSLPRSISSAPGGLRGTPVPAPSWGQLSVVCLLS